MAYRMSGQHINALELMAIHIANKWRARSPRSLGKRFVHFTDSQVAQAALTKGRSSSNVLPRILKKNAALVLAASFQPGYAYVRTSDNLADGPSRFQQWGAKREARCRAERSAARRALGHLRDLAVSEVTRRRYALALEEYMNWRRRENHAWPRTYDGLDLLVAEFVEWGWLERLPKNGVANVLSSLQHHAPILKKRLPEAWRHYSS
jgi:hypothetical protein